MKKNYIYSIDNLRGLAILLVFFTHSQSLNYIINPIIHSGLKFIIGNATTIFVFISGFLFHYLQSQKFNYIQFLSQKFKFVVLPYLFFITATILIGILINHPEKLGMDISEYIFKNIFIGGIVIGPLWFIPMIIMFFLTSPIFLRLSKFPISALSYVTLFLLIFSLFTARPINQSNPALSYIHFLGFYTLGIYLSANIEFRNKMVDNYKGILIFTTLSFIGLMIMYSYEIAQSKNIHHEMEFFKDFGKLNLIHTGKLFMTIGLFVAFERYLNHKNRILGYFSHISFGIFFIHGFLLVLFSRLWRFWHGFDYPILSLVAETIFGLGGSILCIYIGKKIFGKWHRYILGC